MQTLAWQLFHVIIFSKYKIELACYALQSFHIVNVGMLRIKLKCAVCRTKMSFAAKNIFLWYGRGHFFVTNWPSYWRQLANAVRYGNGCKGGLLFKRGELVSKREEKRGDYWWQCALRGFLSVKLSPANWWSIVFSALGFEPGAI